MKFLLFVLCNLHQVKKIVQGQFSLFQSMYKPFLLEYEAKELLKLSSSGGHQANISQVYLDLQVLKLKLVQFAPSIVILFFEELVV